MKKQIDGYTIIKKLGEGLYAKSYLAVNSNNQEVVLKKFKNRIFRKNGNKNIYEAVILSQLNNATFPSFLGVINKKEFYAFVLEYKHGITLNDMIFKEKHVFSDVEIKNIFNQLLDIIEYLHNKKIVHRDIRIPNIIINNNDVSLIDYGLSRFINGTKYFANIDYSYLGDVLLFLLYSRVPVRLKNTKWYNELNLTNGQITFLKKMLGPNAPYRHIIEIKEVFNKTFFDNPNL